MSLSFEASTHCYTLDGVLIPSVTRTLDHAGLVSYDMVKEDVLERKSKLGIFVHQATQYFDEGELDWSSVHEKLKGRVEAWINFRADTGFVPRRIEKICHAKVNGMTYGLTADRHGFLGKDEVIIDLKTSVTILPWCAIQTAGYALGVPPFEEEKPTSPMFLFAKRRRLVVQLKEDGRYKKYDFNDFNDAQVFLSALHITCWKLGHGMPMRKIEEEEAA